MIKVGKDLEIGGNELTFIFGSCIIESETQAFSLAESLKEMSQKNSFKFVYKASFDKANRTSISSFRGPGLEEGLKIVEKIGREFDLPTTVDIHSPEQADIVKDVVDIIQIPAFLCRQTDLVVAAAKTGKVVNIKKGQFLAPNDTKEIVKKIESAGNNQIMLTERGTAFGYNNLVVDFTALPIMQSTGYPVVFDATHSVQLPGGHGKESGGRREYVPNLAKAAVAAGADVVFMEVHKNPSESKSDRATIFPMDSLENLIGELIDISKVVRR
jgi:2-dehydro-3-deoxyphosphooctonate aldolase (KDO 8-P synthase)